MSNISQNNYRRLNFSKNQHIADPPDLLGVQINSFADFLQQYVEPTERKDQGLEAALRSIFPIFDNSESHKMEYMHYTFGEPKFDESECRSRGLSYSMPLRVMLRLIYFEKGSTESKPKIKEIKEQEVYFGDFPIMTQRGSFIINGTDRAIVSQLHKSPGVFFKNDAIKSPTSSKPIFSAQILPQRGSWINFEFDSKDLFYARFDKKPKFFATIFLKALGYSQEDILKRFYPIDLVHLTDQSDKNPEERFYYKDLNLRSALNQRAALDIKHPKTGEIIVNKGRKINKNYLKKIEAAGIKQLQTPETDLLGRFSAENIYDNKGQILCPSNRAITKEILSSILKEGIKTIKLLYIGQRTIGKSLRETLAIDKVKTTEEALLEVYKRMRPGDLPVLEVTKLQLYNMFFNPDRYDLSFVGRMKINRKLGLDVDPDSRVLNNEDILSVAYYLLHLKEGIGTVDDIDHLSNRRVKAVGELIESRFKVGLARMEKVIKETMSLQAEEGIKISDVVNAKPLLAVVNEFFGSSQLSQFMDQTNPLSEITHKRRLSALGPGGLSRDRAGFEVRDVHNSHYGRICPIETPEGPNIGLISSLACYSRINEYGFIETPYRKIVDGRVTNDVVYLSAFDDDKYKILQPDTKLDDEDNIKDEFVSARVGGEFITVHRDEAEYIDLSPKQLVSVAASLVPFLEHDDANRALMGANMQRQAVPLIKPKSPFVGTGMEEHVARYSGNCIVAQNSGIVDSVDASRIVIETDKKPNYKNVSNRNSINVDIYHLVKYDRSNQNTCVNNRPLVKVGDYIKQGQVIADGSSSERGELAIGQNVLVAFMPWHGHNYEDSILVSERILSEDKFTSVHIEELECLARDTKLGKELITSDLPNVSEYLLRNLDGHGVIRVGSYVKTGDILVGKVTPKGESHMNPEDRLLRAIFGDKAGDVRDTSLKVSQGIEGVVIDVKLYNRRGVDKDQRILEVEREKLNKIDEDFKDEIRIIKNYFKNKSAPVVKDRPLKQDLIHPRNGELLFKKGTVLTAEKLSLIPEEAWTSIKFNLPKEEAKEFDDLCQRAYQQYQIVNLLYEQKIKKETEGDDLPPGIIRSVKVYIAIKRRVSVGDKMAGRHGNKGVISRIVPVEDMPYMEDGQPVDIVLNPLGVPSRMNVGQILETHLGLISKKLGEKIDGMLATNQSVAEIKKFVSKIYNSPTFDKYLKNLNDEDTTEFFNLLRKGIYFSTPVFDGAKESEIHRLADLCDLERHGKLQLYDGLTGQPFEQKVTVGYMYMMKLHHMADEKIHARSIGPYSLVTQQPLGGKAQRGGQRFGEMEVWALEAYGAAYALREMLTVKSDDVIGRSKVYEAIVKGVNNEYSGIPESFKVLINELRALCLDFKLIKDLRLIDQIEEK